MDFPFGKTIKKIIGFLFGARFFSVAVLYFALYVATIFIFNSSESLRQFAFDFRAHAILLSALLSVTAGSLINQFYDQEKDRLIRPLRTRLQSFVRQSTFLYAYLFLSGAGLVIAAFLSWKIFLFFLVYQVLIWAYSHRLSRTLIVNNLMFTALTLYPFLSMVLYYQAFSLLVIALAVFLFLILLMMDIMKDVTTRRADMLLGYNTIPDVFGIKRTFIVLNCLTLLLSFFSLWLALGASYLQIMQLYFGISAVVFLSFFIKDEKNKILKIPKRLFFLKIWIFLGILAMLADGLLNTRIKLMAIS